LLHLPGADFGARRTRREHENHRVGLANHAAEAPLPLLATGDAVAVDDALKAVGIERRIKLVGKLQIIAAVGDKDAKLCPAARVSSDRLRRGCYTGRARKRCGSGTGIASPYTAPTPPSELSAACHQA